MSRLVGLGSKASLESAQYRRSGLAGTSPVMRSVGVIGSVGVVGSVGVIGTIGRIRSVGVVGAVGAVGVVGNLYFTREQNRPRECRIKSQFVL